MDISDEVPKLKGKQYGDYALDDDEWDVLVLLYQGHEVRTSATYLHRVISLCI